MSTICPKCHMENPAESKSCVHCGLLLDAVDKIPTYHPETEETKTVEAPTEDLKNIQPPSDQLDTGEAVEAAQEIQSELPASKSFFSGLRGIFRKNKAK